MITLYELNPVFHSSASDQSADSSDDQITDQANIVSLVLKRLSFDGSDINHKAA